MKTSFLLEAIGWTLIHSLWQAALVFVIASAITKFSKNASIRYVVNCFGLLFLLFSSLITFLTLNPKTTSQPLASNGAWLMPVNHADHSVTELPNGASWISEHMHWLVLLWLVGMIAFTARLIIGYIFVNKLRRSAVIIENDWNQLLSKLSGQLHIRSLIQLAESKLISTPMAIGYLKPMILIPAGMFTGLSISEIESIFIHELAHIKRNDFIVNVAQCVIEIIFFFNPFVWFISQRIRAEREYCCDDIVLRMDVTSANYSTALIKVAEFRNQQMLALSAAGSKNELFNRIKRIMEKSTTKTLAWNKLAPAILLGVGLLCASWITVRDFRTPEAIDMAKPAQDTLKKKPGKSAHYYKQSVVSVDKNGEPHEQITENFEGDSSLRELIFPPAMAVPDFPDLVAIPAFPDFESDFDLAFQDLDTIPVKFRAEEFEKFGKEFEENFQKHFGNFYEEHEDEFKKMMEEIQQDFQGKFGNEDWKQLQMAAVADARALVQNQKFRDEEFALKAQAESLKAVAEWHKAHAEEIKANAEQMRAWEDANRANLQELQKKMQKLELRMQRYQQKLKEELVRDGYLGKDEVIENLQIHDDGSLEVNGKKIKPSDEGKYKKLHDEWMAEKVAQ